jgi:hypothetical protein
VPLHCIFICLMDGSRTRFLKTAKRVDPCSFQSSLEVTRQQYQLQPEAKNIILYTHHLVTSQILLGVDTEMGSFLLPFFQSLRVRYNLLVISSLSLRDGPFSSEQTPAKTSRVPDVLSPTLPQLSWVGLRAAQALYDTAKSHEMP